MKAIVYNQKGEKTGELTLNKDIFGIEVNAGLIHQAVVYQETNSRQAIAHTKQRGEVRGGGRKPYKQKGTGNARQGSIRSPQWRHGGIVFGPRNTRNFKIMMPQKQRRKALFCALSSKVKNVLILESYEGTMKTKPFVEMMKKLPVERKVLVVLPGKNEAVQKSARNLPGVKTIAANYLNVKDVLHYDSLLFLKEALGTVETTFLKT